MVVHADRLESSSVPLLLDWKGFGTRDGSLSVSKKKAAFWMLWR